MFLKDDYNKKMFILDDQNLIYKGKFRKKTIRRKDIRSVFYDEDRMGILTYDGKIYSFNIIKLLFSERRKLKVLREELNKENILFDYDNYRFDIINISLVWGYVMLVSARTIHQLFYQAIAVLIFVPSMFLIKNILPRAFYNIDKGEFEIIKFRNNFKYKKGDIDKIELERINQNITSIQFKKDGSKYKMYFRENQYLKRIYNLSLIKLFK